MKVKEFKIQGMENETQRFFHESIISVINIWISGLYLALPTLFATAYFSYKNFDKTIEFVFAAVVILSIAIILLVILRNSIFHDLDRLNIKSKKIKYSQLARKRMARKIL